MTDPSEADDRSGRLRRHAVQLMFASLSGLVAFVFTLSAVGFSPVGGMTAAVLAIGAFIFVWLGADVDLPGVAWERRRSRR